MLAKDNRKERRKYGKLVITQHDIKAAYKIGTFEFIQKYIIKTVEKTHTIVTDTTFESIKLLTQEDIDTFQEEYNFIHRGLVQVGVSPLTRLGLNKPICLA